MQEKKFLAYIFKPTINLVASFLKDYLQVLLSLILEWSGNRTLINIFSFSARKSLRHINWNFLQKNQNLAKQVKQNISDQFYHLYTNNIKRIYT